MNCALTTSRRGTYFRKKHPQQELEKQREQEHDQDQELTNDTSPPEAGTEGPAHDDFAFHVPQQIRTALNQRFIPEHGSAESSIPTTRSETSGLTDRASTNNTQISLASLFEDFLERQGHNHDSVAGKCRVVFFGHPSPLTFALEEPQRGGGATSSFHDADSEIIENIGSMMSPSKAHPSHITSGKLAFLKAKNCFDSPEKETLDALVSAFLTRFYPLYPVVDTDEFLRLHAKQKLPWLLLHAVCFAGATYCDQSVIHRSGFKGRWHARRQFYDKAKALFDVEYETNKITLLQTVIMLSFWGPQMRSYWNPCSWIGFGATLAISLGIYNQKSTVLAQIPPRHKALLRRLWWTLSVRDAYCAALLGRPFRINIQECDAEVPNLDDFNVDPDNSSQEDQTHALYQVQIAKLSLILRKIVHLRFPPTTITALVEDLHALLEQWKSQLPAALDWTKQKLNMNLYSASLKIIFHHHLILLYLPRPNQLSLVQDLSPLLDDECVKLTKLAGQMISSTALTLMTKSMVGQMPQEVFAGFFISGIVFYRQIQRSQDLSEHLGRAALDNCQIIMNEARDCWDPARWGMKIFDFLLSSVNHAEAVSEDSSGLATSTAIPSTTINEALSDDFHDSMNGFDADILHSIELDCSRHQNINGNYNDFLLMPSYFTSTPETW